MADDPAHEDGWAALAEGRWADARGVFERALADDERPEAFEGLSWAAWWLDDAPTVFDARSRAYALFRRCGDARGAARMATWLASDTTARGRSPPGGCGVRTAFWTSWSPARSTAGSPSTRGTSPTPTG